MTYLTNELDIICKNFCESCGTCPQEHECGDRALIKETIIRIMGVNIDC